MPDEDAFPPRMNVGMEVAAWVNILAGLVVVALPFLDGVRSGAVFWNNEITGLVVVVLAAFNALYAATGRAASALGPAIVNALLGLWLAAFSAFSGAEGRLLVGTLIAGVVIAVAAAYNVWAARRAPPPHPTARSAV